MGKYHTILGVSESASEAEIKKAFHKLSKQYHPDLNPGDKATEEKYKEISAAYTGLMAGDDGDDKNARAHEYAQRHFHDSGFMDAMEGIMRSAFVFQQHGHVGRKGQDVRVVMRVPVRKLFTGGDIVFEGQIPTFHRGGFGYAPRRRVINLKPETPIGTQFRFPGEGSTGMDGTTGTLIVEVHPENDGIYECDELNLVVRGPISTLDALVGKTKRFKLPNGEVQEFDVPVGAQNNQVLVIPRKGLKAANGMVGDLLIVFTLKTPALSEANRKKLAKLIKKFDELDEKNDQQE